MLKQKAYQSMSLLNSDVAWGIGKPGNPAHRAGFLLVTLLIKISFGLIEIIWVRVTRGYFCFQ
jgi:hypothetical protein